MEQSLTLALGAILASGSTTISLAHKGHGAQKYHVHRISGLWRADGYWYPQFKDCYFPYRYDFPIYCGKSTTLLEAVRMGTRIC